MSPDAGTGVERSGSLLVTDFTSASPDLGWYVVNDNVMGGRSEGGFEVVEGELRFAGRTNTNGGGFSSIRTEELNLDLSAFTGIRVRVRADGRRYTWRLTTNARVYGRPVGYWADFDTAGGGWQDVDIPFEDFIPQFRGTVLDGPPLDTGEITGMGLMIYDKQDGRFELQLATVQAYADTSPFLLANLEWEKRVLVVSAPGADDAMLEKQLAAVEATRAEFADRDMLLVTLTDDGNATAGDRRLSRDEVAATRSALRVPGDSFVLRLIGKDGSVKLSDDAAVPMEDIYGLIDGMPMRRREMQDR